MKTVILGGTFNPPHHGHLYLAQCALAMGYDRVLFIPSGRQPKKSIAGNISANDRLSLLQLAIGDEKQYAISDYEINREDVSYAVDTVSYLLSAKLVGEKPGFVIGDDLVEGFVSWKDPLILSRISQLILARRLPDFNGKFVFDHQKMDNIILPHSSSLIRELVRTHKPFKHLVPDAVFEEILHRGFYADEVSGF